jgi:broad specificity phosphatase PhoE
MLKENLVRLIMVRHAQTDWNKNRLVQGGGVDSELNNTGLEQAQRLGQALQNTKLAAVYAGPLRRTLATAAPIAQKHGLEIIREPDLIEINVGDLNGAPMKQFGDLLNSYFSSNRDAGQFRMPGGESLAELAARTWGATQRILKQHPDGEVVAVSHHLALLTIICQALGLDLGYFRRMKQDLAAISILEFKDGKATLAQLNDTCHLNGLK